MRSKQEIERVLRSKISNEGEIEGEEASNCTEIDACLFTSPFLSMLAYKQA
jgi:hypothetical protein